MAWENCKIKQLIFVTSIFWYLLPASGISYDKRRHSSFGKNGLQDENFHELNRWKPPVRLIPFDPSRIARIPYQEPDSTSESGDGSGASPKAPCDDEDGDCGGVNVDSPGDGIEVKTITRLPDSSKLQTVKSNVNVTLEVASSKVPAQRSTKGSSYVKTTTGETLRSTLASTIKKSRSRTSFERTTSMKTESVSSEHETFTTRRASTTSPITGDSKEKTARDEAVQTTAATQTTRQPTTTKSLATTATTTATSIMTTATSKLAEKISTREATNERTKATLSPATTVFTTTIKSIASTKLITKSNDMVTEYAAKGDISFDKESKNASEPNTTQAMRYVNKTHSQFAMAANTSYYATNISSESKPDILEKGAKMHPKIVEDSENIRKRFPTSVTKPPLNLTVSLKMAKNIGSSNRSDPRNKTGNFYNTTNIRKQVNRTTGVLNITSKTYKSTVAMQPTQTAAKLNESSKVDNREIQNKVLLTNAPTSQPTKTEIYENRMEKVVGNLCQGISCKFGGKCREDGANRGKCLCPIGRGGKYCEREQHFTHPKFHGSSYISFNGTRKIGKNFRVSIEFKADAMNGVLFFGGNPENTSANFFAIILIDGYVQLRTECGAGFIAITNAKKITVTDWHRVTARKFNGKVFLQVNSEPLVSDGSKCLKQNMHLNKLYIGGLRSNLLQMKNIGLIPGFKGCVRKFMIDQKDYVLKSKANKDMSGIGIADCTTGSCFASKCANGGICIPATNTSSRCSCQLGSSDTDCSKGVNISVPRFNGAGYIQFDGLASSAWSKLDIEIVLKPQSEQGLLFYNGDSTEGRGDFILVSLKDGFVELRFDCGTGEAIIRSRRKIVINCWHHIRISRTGNLGRLSLDTDDPVVGKSRGSFQMLKLREPLFIGGINRFSSIPVSADVHASFNGCIEKVVVNKRKLQWRDAVDGRDVYNCNSHGCMKNACSNNGICESHKGESWCHCYLGYSGKTCENGTEISTPMFSGHSFLKFEDRELFRHLSLPTSIFSLEFKTNHPHGLILWNGQKYSNRQWKGDFMSVALIDGFLVCRYNLGSGDVVLNSTQKYNDNKWHKVWLYRNKGKSKMHIDETEVAKIDIKSNYTMLNTDGELFLGGAENIISTTGLRHLYGFHGCIKNFKLGNTMVNLIEKASSGHNVEQCF